jgi:hypothetical protein
MVGPMGLNNPEPIGDRAPMLGEQVRVGTSETIWTILSEANEVRMFPEKAIGRSDE